MQNLCATKGEEKIGAVLNYSVPGHKDIWGSGDKSASFLTWALDGG
jgi:hypothetical protein